MTGAICPGRIHTMMADLFVRVTKVGKWRKEDVRCRNERGGELVSQGIARVLGRGKVLVVLVVLVSKA